MQERGPIAGIGIAAPGEIIKQFSFDQSEPESYYMPTEAEILVIEERYTESAVMTPPWHLVQAKLFRNAGGEGNIGDLTAPAVIALLDRESECELKRSSDSLADYSAPKSPSEWKKLYQCSWDTLKKRFDEGSIRNKKLSLKSYRIHKDDLPELYSKSDFLG
ncbi:MAG: hypothetical protein K0U86_08665 [Planctomycetes bacterium]|nr:hypothetical protein [Planctomycetota bacterium]MCH9724962.1 hypothetical protein [Planctomycetota bacterium]MCH9777577.1 hypothetical protein [Planctomycetota bacterium]MCH9793457.1 hypothetical protein [Planctomycetota bacterium]